MPAVRKPVTIQWMVWGGTDRYKPFLEIYKRTYPETAAYLNVELISPGSSETDSYKALRLALAAGGEGLPDSQASIEMRGEVFRACDFYDAGCQVITIKYKHDQPTSVIKVHCLGTGR